MNWAIVAIAIVYLLIVLIGQTVWFMSRIRSLHQQAEQDRRDSEDRFYQLFDQAPFVIQIYAPDGTALKTNKAWEAVWNVPRSVLATYNVFQDAQVVKLGLLPAFQQAFAGEPTTIPPFFYNPAANGFPGRSRWLEWTSYSIKNVSGEVEQVVVITKDVTDRKAAEAVSILSKEQLRQANVTLESCVAARTAALQQANAQLQTAEERWQLALAGNQDGIWDWNIATGETFGSPQWYKLLGFEPNEIQFSYREWQDRLHPDDRDRVATAKIVYLARQSPIYSTEYRFRCKDGSYRWFQAKAQAVWNEQGDPLRMVGSIRNIDDRKAAEAEIAQSLSTLQATLEATADGILVFDRHQNITHFNQRFLHLWQFSAEAIGGSSDRQLVALLQAQLIEAKAFAAQVQAEYSDLTRIDLSTWTLKDGRTFERYSQPQWLKDKAIGRVVSYRDITKRQQAEAALQASEVRYRSVIAAMAEGIVLIDADGAILANNASAERILGLTREQLIGRSPLDSSWHTIDENGELFPGEQHPSMVTLRTGQPCQNVVMGVFKPDDQLSWISINTQPLFHPDESLPYAVVASFSDITDRKRAEDQVRLLQTLALAIPEASDFNSALEQVLRLVCEAMNWNYGEAWIAGSDNLLKCAPAYHIHCDRPDQLLQLNEFRLHSEAFSFPFNVGISGRVWATQQPEWKTDVFHELESYFSSRSIAHPKNIQTALGVPVLANNQVLIVLVFFKLDAVDEDRQLMDSLAAIAAQLGSVLQRKQIEAALKESEERFHLFMNHSPTTAFIRDEAGRYVYVNETVERIFDVKLADLKGKTSFDWLPAEIASKTNENDLSVLSTGQAATFIEIVPNSDHSIHTWLTFKFPFQDTAGLRYVGGIAIDITKQQQMAEALQQSEVRYRAIVEDQTEFIARYLPDGTITFANQAYADYFGRSPQDLIGTCYQPIIFEADRDRVAQLVASMSADNPVVVIENRVVVNDEVRWTQWHNRMLFDEQNCFMEFQSVGRDITDLKQAEETLFQEKELAQVTLQSIGDAVITTDAVGNIRSLNPVAEMLTGWSDASAQGLPLTDVFRIVHETTREPVQNPIAQALQENCIVDLANHTVLIARNNQEIAIEDSAAPIRNRDGQIIGAVMVFHDVTRTRTLSRQLSWQASHDALTGLVNRREFERRVEQALRLAQLGYQTDALCFLDLDRFKIVNDTCGHAAGDELLRQIAVRLQEKIRKTDTLARLGGDEFGVLLSRCSLDQAQQIANELREAVQSFRFVRQEQVFVIGVSIGLVDIDRSSESLSELISAADAACYAAKNSTLR